LSWVYLVARNADSDPRCKIFIGGLTAEAEKYDLEDAFSKFGPIKSSWVARKPPGFGFIEMEDERDARDAAKALDGTRIAGSRVRVEMSNGRKREGRRGGDRSRSRSRGRRSRSRTPPRRSRRSPSYGDMRKRSRSADRGGDRGRSRSRSR